MRITEIPTLQEKFKYDVPMLRTPLWYTFVFFFMVVIQHTLKKYLNIQQSEYCDHIGIREVKRKTLLHTILDERIKV